MKREINSLRKRNLYSALTPFIFSPIGANEMAWMGIARFTPLALKKEGEGYDADTPDHYSYLHDSCICAGPWLLFVWMLLIMFKSDIFILAGARCSPQWPEKGNKTGSPLSKPTKETGCKSNINFAPITPLAPVRAIYLYVSIRSLVICVVLTLKHYCLYFDSRSSNG